jgi:transposase
MKPYSQDLRERVLAKASAGKETQAVIAATFGISLSTLEKWLRRKRTTRKTTPLPPAHGPKPILENHAALIRSEVKRQPDITLVELCARLSRCIGIEVSPSTMCRALQRLRLPRKKVTA